VYKSKKPRRVNLPFLALWCLLLLTSAAEAQFRIELQTCQDLKIVQVNYGASSVETAACIGPTKFIRSRGTLRNVHIVATFPPVPTGAGVTFMVTKNDANGEYVQNVDYPVSPRHTTAYARLTINTPGKYFVRMANYYDKSQVWATTDFTIGEDTVGPRAAGNTPAGLGKLSICKEIDDDWKCVGESNQWPANTAFNVYFQNPGPVGVEFIGIVIHKQGPDEKDIEFINEYQQNIGEKNTKYATIGEMLKLPAGVYSVYIIAWGKRELLTHQGNFKEYFAKTVLTVK
jgi:hypothetical protein